MPELSLSIDGSLFVHWSAQRDRPSLAAGRRPSSEAYELDDRLGLLEQQLATVNRMAMDNALPDAVIDPSGLKITPLDSAVPDKAQALIDRTAKMLPHVKITELLMDVDEWTGFSRHFTHLKSGEPALDRIALLTAILAAADPRPKGHEALRRRFASFSYRALRPHRRRHQCPAHPDALG